MHAIAGFAASYFTFVTGLRAARAEIFSAFCTCDAPPCIVSFALEARQERVIVGPVATAAVVQVVATTYLAEVGFAALTVAAAAGTSYGLAVMAGVPDLRATDLCSAVAGHLCMVPL